MCTYATQDGIVVSQANLGGGMSNTGTVGTGVLPNQQYASAATNTYKGAATNTFNGAATNTFNSAATNTYSAATNAYNKPNAYGTQNQGVGYNSAATRTVGNGYQNVGQTAGTNAYTAGRYGGTNYNTKTSKRKMISMILVLCAIVWICLGD